MGQQISLTDISSLPLDVPFVWRVWNTRGQRERARVSALSYDMIHERDTISMCYNQKGIHVIWNIYPQEIQSFLFTWWSLRCSRKFCCHFGQNRFAIFSYNDWHLEPYPNRSSLFLYLALSQYPILYSELYTSVECDVIIRLQTLMFFKLLGHDDNPDIPIWGREKSVIDVLKGSDGHVYKGRFKQVCYGEPHRPSKTCRMYINFVCFYS